MQVIFFCRRKLIEAKKCLLFYSSEHWRNLRETSWDAYTMDFPKGPMYHFELKPDLPSHALHPPFFFGGGERGSFDLLPRRNDLGFFGVFFFPSLHPLPLSTLLGTFLKFSHWSGMDLCAWFLFYPQHQ